MKRALLYLLYVIIPIDFLAAQNINTRQNIFENEIGQAILNWDKFTMEGVQVAEQATDATELVENLQNLFQVIAPTVQIFPTGSEPPVNPGLTPPDNTSNLSVIQLA